MGSFINGDCLEYMRGYPDNHFDLAIVDPPYGDGGVSGQAPIKRGSAGASTSIGGTVNKVRRGGGITNGTPAEVSRTGGTWAAKYGKNHSVGYRPK